MAAGGTGYALAVALSFFLFWAPPLALLLTGFTCIAGLVIAPRLKPFSCPRCSANFFHGGVLAALGFRKRCAVCGIAVGTRMSDCDAPWC
jgi:hypothetical protein